MLRTYEFLRSSWVASTRTSSHGVRARTAPAETVCTSATKPLSESGAIATVPRIALVCSGTDGHVTAEDGLVAGCLVDRLVRGGVARTLNDQARLARALWTETWAQTGDRDSLAAAMAQMHGGRNLVRRKMVDDIVYCATIDRFDNVPRLDIGSWTIR